MINRLYPDGLEDAIALGDVDDVRLRFYLSARLMKMKYGDRVAIPHRIVHHAWPPTGDQDRTIEGAFRAMALATGGLRPEASYTTEERIARDLDDSFRVERMHWDRDYRWLFERRLDCCPQCNGEGHYDVWDFSDAPKDFHLDMNVDMNLSEATVSKKRIQCSHEPDTSNAVQSVSRSSKSARRR